MIKTILKALKRILQEIEDGEPDMARHEIENLMIYLNSVDDEEG